MTKPSAGPSVPNRWTAADIPDLTGRTFLVTGASSGLGLETTRQLARRGAHVIMAVRDEAKGRAVERELRAAQPDANLEVRRLDLVDLDSVRAFAENLVRAGRKVDVLVNNAGILAPPRTLTPQGHESQFGVNHLGHFALTGLLFDLLRAAERPRVVTVSSNAHKFGRIHFDDLTGQRRYSPMFFYGQSKLANVLFGLELDRRVRAAGLPLRSVLAHPGYAATQIHASSGNPVLRVLMRLGGGMLAQSTAMGALNQLYAATDPRAEGGQMIGPGGWGEQRGYPALVRPAGTDPVAARRLWELSEELTGVRFPLPPCSG